MCLTQPHLYWDTFFYRAGHSSYDQFGQRVSRNNTGERNSPHSHSPADQIKHLDNYVTPFVLQMVRSHPIALDKRPQGLIC